MICCSGLTGGAPELPALWGGAVHCCRTPAAALMQLWFVPLPPPSAGTRKRRHTTQVRLLAAAAPSKAGDALFGSGPLAALAFRELL